MIRLLISILMIASTFARSVQNSNDKSSIVFFEEEEEQSNNEENKHNNIRVIWKQTDICTAQNNSMPFIKSPYEFECFPLTSRGPCEKEDEWFVLDPDSAFPAAKCIVNPCAKFPGRVQYFDECVLLSHSGYCPPGMEMRINPFGHGECDCKEGYLMVEDEAGHPRCYQENLQGPCKEDYQLVLLPGSEKPTCQKNNCDGPGQVRWTNGKCIESPDCFGTGVIFKDGALECDIEMRQLFSVIGEVGSECEEGKSKNEAGECTDLELNVARNTRSSTRGRLALRNKSLSKFLCAKYPDKFGC